MKRVLSVLICLAMIACLLAVTGCSNSKTTSTNTNKSKSMMMPSSGSPSR